MTPAPITMDELQAAWDAMDAIRGEVLEEDDPHPERSFTVQQYAERYDVPYPTAQGQLKRLVATGKIRDGWKRAANGYGRKQLIRCYWVP